MEFVYDCPSCVHERIRSPQPLDKFSRDCRKCGHVMEFSVVESSSPQPPPQPPYVWAPPEVVASKAPEPPGEKFDDKKHKWSLVPWRELATVVEVLQMGAQKYSVDNWKGVRPTSRYIDAAFRHLTAYATGDKLDNESSKSHLAHTVCCMLFLMYFDNEGV